MVREHLELFLGRGVGEQPFDRRRQIGKTPFVGGAGEAAL